MKKNYLLLNLFLGLLFCFSGQVVAQYASPKPQVPPDIQQVNRQFSAEGLRFTENKGQVADLDGRLRPDILFTAQNVGVKLFLTANGIHYQFRRDFAKPEQINDKHRMPVRSEIEEMDSTQFYRLDLSLKGANPDPKLIKEGEGLDVENFFLAHCPEGITGVKNYNRITYKEVYPNIDWVVYVKDGMLEYDFVVRPGGKVDDIRLQYNGAENIDLDRIGALHIKTPLGKVIEQKPLSFQEEGKEVASRFELEGNTIGFEVPEYNENIALTIDPSIVWATYYGGTSQDWGYSCVADQSGNIYLAGITYSATGISSGGFQNSLAGTQSAFLVKFNAAGIRQWATYYGNAIGRNKEQSCAIDASGNIYLSGSTTSGSGIAFGGFQNIIGGLEDNFLVKFNGSGERLWATYYGGPGIEYSSTCKADRFGNVYLAGFTTSVTGISNGGFQNNNAGGSDAYLVKFNSTGERIWSTYYGGNGEENGNSCDVDFTGNIYLAGSTSSISGIASGGFKVTYGGGAEDAFLVKFDGNGNRIWATYYGGANTDVGFSCATDASENIYLAGYTLSRAGIASGGFQTTYKGGSDAFLVKFNKNGGRQWGTYYGGEGEEVYPSCAVNASDEVFLAGRTVSNTGIASGGFQNSPSGNYDAFVAKFNPSGNRLWGSYFGGLLMDEINSISCEVNDNLIIAGSTQSTSGLALNGFQNTFGGAVDAFLVKISDVAPSDTDNDGVPDASDCAPNDATKYRTANLYKDADNDGYDAGQENICYGAEIPAGYKAATLGTDCNDTDATMNPAQTEVCGNGKDDDCNPATSDICTQPDADGDGVPDAIDCAPNDNTKYRTANLYLDKDNDGYDAGQENVCYGATIPTGYKTTTLGTDCDDTNNTITGPRTWYKDSDDDGYSDGTTLVQCFQPEDYKLAENLIALSGDCNETNGSIHPGATEICDGIDNNCDGAGDEGSDETWYKDADNDGYSDGTTLTQCFKPADYKLAANLLATIGDCNDANPAIHPGAAELCDGIDNDCDGQVDGDIPTWYKDADNDGYSDGVTLTQCTQPSGYKLAANLTATSGDCDDTKSSIHPGATELCDGIDNDCDAQTDEGCPVGTAWYFDYDKDGYGNAAKVVYAVSQPYKYVANSSDCRDWDAAFHPGATELCDGLDNDCDGMVDEGCPGVKTWYRDGDGDGYGNPKYTKIRANQPAGFVDNDDDCRDWDANVYPGHGCSPVTVNVGSEGNTIQPKAMLETAAEIQVFPNPARDEVKVTLNGFEVGKKVELQMIQADGKVVSSQSIIPLMPGHQLRIDVRKLHTGYYLLQVRQGVLQQTKKVLIVR